MSASRAGPERRAGFLRLLDGDQAVDDLAALHQEAVHGLVDAVDLLPQVGERWWSSEWARGVLAMSSTLWCRIDTGDGLTKQRKH